MRELSKIFIFFSCLLPIYSYAVDLDYFKMYACYKKLIGFSVHSTQRTNGGLFLLSEQPKEMLYFTEKGIHHCPYGKKEVYRLKLSGDFKDPIYVQPSDTFVDILNTNTQDSGKTIPCALNVNESATKIFKEDLEKQISKVFDAYEMVNKPMTDKTGRTKVENYPPYKHTAALVSCQKLLPERHPLQKTITDELMDFPISHVGEPNEFSQ